MCVCLCEFVCTIHMKVPKEATGLQNPWNWTYRWL